MLAGLGGGLGEPQRDPGRLLRAARRDENRLPRAPAVLPLPQGPAQALDRRRHGDAASARTRIRSAAGPVRPRCERGWKRDRPPDRDRGDPAAGRHHRENRDPGRSLEAEPGPDRRIEVLAAEGKADADPEARHEPGRRQQRARRPAFVERRGSPG